MELAVASLSPISIATLFIFLFISHYFFQKWRHHQKVGNQQKQAISPPGAWPIIGHLHLLRKAKLPHHALATMADDYGPIFRLQLGTRSALVISNREMAKEALYHNDAAAASRPSFYGMKKFSYDYALFGLAPTSHYWREMRKIIISHLLSNQRVDMLKTVMFSQIEMSLNELYDAARRSNESGGVSVEMRRWFRDVALNTVLKIIMGKRCVGPNGCDEDAAKELQKTITESFRIMDGGLLSDFFPLFGWLGLDRDVKKIEKIAKRSDRVLQRWLEEHRRKRSGCGSLSLDTKENGDFMDSLITLHDRNKLPTCFDGDTIIKATILSMISGGTESTMVTLTWAISLMLNNPHTIEKAQQELDEIVGRERRVNESDINKLVYIQAIIKETMRLYPTAPLIGPREFLQDCMVGDYFVSKGTQLIPNVWKIQTDPKIWPDPFEFKPERFLTTHKDVELKGKNFELLPFGTGRRGCPGVAFALQMEQFILAGFLHLFDVKNMTSELIDMSERYGLANEKVTPLYVLVSPRLPSHIYA
ncbi:cytochrome P450 82A3-like [Benincasa hispida]|uniref:cytochrome P450 82A3-like n=1 Tax=Benincasa hispida TaxID=102211 RepID=UPI001902A212|nr:cytochrome P450 82A3-like [Benincasa hispida]